MAARFRVGAGGNWSDTGHWSTTSGGASGAAAPTSSDDVTFDSGCSGTTTIDVPANANSITMNNVGVTLLHSSTSTVVGTVTLTTGTINTNGQSFSWGAFSSSNSNVRTFTTGASAGTLTSASPWTTSTATNMTMTANTSTMTLSGASANFASTINLNLNGMSVAYTGGGNSMQLAGSVTFRNFTITGTASPIDVIRFVGSPTITGQFLATGNNVNQNRLWVMTDNEGTVRTITVTGSHGAHANVDFMDITIAGAAGTLTGTSIGDAGGISGITASPAATQTWQGTSGGNWSDVTKWTSRVPLPQDDVRIQSAFTAGQTITLNLSRAGKNVDFTGTTGNPTFAIGGIGVTISFFGSLTIGAVATIGGAGNSTILRGRNGTYTLTSDSANKLSIASLFVDAVGATYKFLRNATFSGQVNVADGTLDGNGFNVTSTIINMNNGNTRGLVFGSGNWTVTSTGTVVDATGATMTPGTGLLIISDSSSTLKTFAGAGKSFPTLQYKSTGSGALTITGSNTFAGLDLECTTARTITLPAGGTQTVSGNLTLQGAAGQNLSVVSSSPGTATTIAQTSCSGTYTHSNLTLSGDVVIRVAVCGPTSPMSLEAPTTLRSPRVVTIPGQEAPPTLLSRIQGCVVALVIPSFNSTDSHPANYAVFSLDDGTINNRIEAVWGVANTWQVRRSGGGNTDTTPTVADSFVSGTRRLIAMAWDATKNYISANGAAFVNGVATGFPTAVSHLMLGRGALGSATGDVFPGTVVWLAGFSAPLSDADVAALQASYVNVDPQFQQLPGSPTFLYTAARGYFVTAAIGVQTGQLSLEALSGIAVSSLDPLEALAAASATSLDPFEALFALTASESDPYEALAGIDAEAEEPFESLVALDAASVVEPFESLVSASQTSQDPLEALGGVASDREDPFEALTQVIVDAEDPFESESSTSKDALLPWESRGVPLRGKAVGATRRTSAAEGETARTSSIVNVKGV